MVLKKNIEYAKKTVTLKDIAVELNTSISTVSRALKGHSRISFETQERVRKKAFDMGYRSHNRLHIDRSKTSKLIGVIVPKISYHLYAMAISGIEQIGEEHGMHIIICQSNESYEREKSLIDELISIGVNGVITSIASGTKEFSHFRKLKDHAIPLVFFNRECDEIDTNKVTIDNTQAAYDATKHLIEVGCKNIAYLGGPETLQINRDRAKGYENALMDNELKLRKEYKAFCEFNKDSTLSAARKLLYSPDHPDGILTFSDQIAISVMLAAKERGISIPEQLCLIGFNNEPVDDLLEPSLTSVDQPGFLMGKEAAKLLLEQLDNRENPFEKRILRSSLIIRNSTNKNKIS